MEYSYKPIWYPSLREAVDRYAAFVMKKITAAFVEYKGTSDVAWKEGSKRGTDLHHSIKHEHDECLEAEPGALTAVTVKLREGHEKVIIFNVITFVNVGTRMDESE